MLGLIHWYLDLFEFYNTNQLTCISKIPTWDKVLILHNKIIIKFYKNRLINNEYIKLFLWPYLVENLKFYWSIHDCIR